MVDDKIRMARCTYYGMPVKRSNYNASCCGKCDESIRSGDGLCHCENESTKKLWFFSSRPDKEFDEFYCACHGCD